MDAPRTNTLRACDPGALRLRKMNTARNNPSEALRINNTMSTKRNVPHSPIINGIYLSPENSYSSLNIKNNIIKNRE
jgi:hypothetical protein